MAVALDSMVACKEFNQEITLPEEVDATLADVIQAARALVPRAIFLTLIAVRYAEPI